MADDNTIIEGTVKFRDGKKWKSRWCVMRKLSPVADSVQLLVYREAKARWGGGTKASLALQQYLGCESGFTLDKHSHTLALLCAHFTVVLAFETRERLMQWQVKVSSHLGEGRQYLVVVCAGAAGGKGRVPTGPARLHLHRSRFALTAGVPPRLLGVWEIAHLRRYGVIDGKFCFEGGSQCGKGEGLHVLVSDQAADILRDFELASRGQLSPKRRTFLTKLNEGLESPRSQTTFRPEMRRELNTIDRSLPPTDLRLYEDPCLGAETGAISPYWPSTERTHFDDMGLGDTASVNETIDGSESAPWNGNGNVMLERCMSCMSKLGALSRSSTAALTPGAKHFNPAWTMEEIEEPRPENIQNAEQAAPDVSHKSKADSVCRCAIEKLPERPPKPNRLDLKLAKKPPLPVPVRSFSHAYLSSIQENSSPKIGPYENYDVPKIPSAEVDGEFYDTPKRLKECLNSELFKMTKSSSANTIVLKKPCGCLLKFGKKAKQPKIVDSEENFQASSCPCQKVTDWANSWIKLPYCNKTVENTENMMTETENLTPHVGDKNALYATIDLSRKTRRKSLQLDYHSTDSVEHRSLDNPEIDDGPLANYENLNFALSLEYYENAKDLLKKAGVTQHELDALSANLNSAGSINEAKTCTSCGHPERVERLRGMTTHDEYLMMEPNSIESNKYEHEKSGYTPMSPISGFAFHTLKHPAKSPIGRSLDEKSASNPTLCGSEESRQTRPGVNDGVQLRVAHERTDYRKRSSSADSSRFLEDVKEFEGSVGSRGSASSIETLRDGGTRGPTPGKHSDADSSEASKSKGGIAAAAGNRDSSSSNDSGVSSWSLRGDPAGGAADFELPATTAATRRRYRSARRAHDPHGAHEMPRRSRSSCGARQEEPQPQKCCSAEAEVPVLSGKTLRSVADSRSTSSGTSDMSDYIETLSICSSHSSSDTPVTLRVVRQTTSTLRPRSGKEYSPLASGLRAVSQPYRHLP
ncbi:unnamed protein product [Leptosia nina]|uniref:IRS-type PTB domain-containing protein n=1 Tax=Leptosia nina TaxID=320188 RepID=A0AAV1K1K0_9NEOP